MENYKLDINDGSQHDRQVFVAAQNAWNDWSELRSKRRRNKDFTYGSQWGDVVLDSDGRKCTEYQHLLENGHEPLTNNVIRRLVRSVVGRFRNTIAGQEEHRDLIDIIESVNNNDGSASLALVLSSLNAGIRIREAVSASNIAYSIDVIRNEKRGLNPYFFEYALYSDRLVRL